MRRALGALGLGLGSLLVALLLAELVVRAFVTVRNVGPSFTEYDPVLGKRLKPSFSALRITPEFRMRLSTNSLGFRGPEPESPPRGAILFVGDSFTMGYGVDDGEEFPALVARAPEARGVPVVNAGIGDNGNGRWIHFLRGKAARFEPRLVVLQVHDNDFDNNLAEGLFALSAEGELVERPIPTPGGRRRVQQLVQSVPGLSSLHLLGLARQLRLPRAAPPADGALPDPARGEALTLRVIEAALDLCDERGWPVLVVLADLGEPRRRALRALLASRGVSAVEVPPKAERPDLYYEVDGHWRPEGHVHTAELVLASRALRAALAEPPALNPAPR